MTKNVHTPEWVKHAVFYQIFPDRFARGTGTTHPPGVQFKPWGSPPEEQGYQGGDLFGIVDRLDYLADLGINALYLNPIFSSASNHRYHTFDYFQVDPLLGGEDGLRALLTAAHNRGIRIVLDGVFNHASRGFWPFHHILENGGNSPYLDWFHIDGWPLRPYSNDAYHPANYRGWADNPALPKFNTDNPGARAFLLEVAKYWIEFGIDGWRLDVPNEIDDDDFWRDFREVVKAVNPEAYIVGEIWHEAHRWLQGDKFDGVMNYYFGKAAMEFFGADSLLPDTGHDEFRLQGSDAWRFGDRVDHLNHLYDWEIIQTQLNMLDSHDSPRALWMMGEDTRALKLVALFQMTMPGAPCIYYGTEIGMSAASDPYCREAFPWDNQGIWDHDLLDYYQRAVHLRQGNTVLRTGTYQRQFGDGKRFAFSRSLGTKKALVCFNAGPELGEIVITDRDLCGRNFQAVWNDEGNSYRNEAYGHLKVMLAPMSASVLLSVP